MKTGKVCLSVVNTNHKKSRRLSEKFEAVAKIIVFLKGPVNESLNLLDLYDGPFQEGDAKGLLF